MCYSEIFHKFPVVSGNELQAHRHITASNSCGIISFFQFPLAKELF